MWSGDLAQRGSTGGWNLAQRGSTGGWNLAQRGGMNLAQRRGNMWGGDLA